MIYTFKQLESLDYNGGTTRTHALRSTSPARNSVQFSRQCDEYSTDQRGLFRFALEQQNNLDDKFCDAGAVEYDPGDDKGFIVIPIGKGKSVVIPG